jgi:hypothetical protein
VFVQTIKNHNRLFSNRTEKETREQTEEAPAEEQVMIPLFILFTSLIHPKYTKDRAASVV